MKTKEVSERTCLLGVCIAVHVKQGDVGVHYKSRLIAKNYVDTGVAGTGKKHGPFKDLFSAWFYYLRLQRRRHVSTPAKLRKYVSNPKDL